MSIQRCLMLSMSMLLLASAGVFGAEGSPTSAQAEAAMREFVVQSTGGASPETLRVREVQACFPAQDRPAGDFLCVIDMSMTGGEGPFQIQVVPFRQSGSTWSLLDPDKENLSPACPSHSEAQRAFRSIRKDETIVVTDGGEDGDIHNERGKFEKVEGPYRLICTYTVKSTLLGEDAEQTFVTYIWREGGAYVFDPEIEAWLD